jgi:hypothetical protein
LTSRTILSEILLATQLFQATLVGTVRDEETAAPLAGAVVVLPDLDRAAATDDAGRYTLRQVPPGPHHITVRFLGYAPRTLHALVPHEGELTIDVALRPEPVRMSSIEVIAPVPVRGLDSTETRTLLDRETSIAAVRSHPLLAEPDAFQALAGGDVVLRPETPDGVHVRGGATDQTAYLLDGVPVFSPFHAAGISSAWNPDAIARLHLDTFEPSVSDPHALSGTVEAVTRAPGVRGRGQATLTTTQARLTIDGPLGGGAGYLASARVGLPEWMVPEDEPSYVRGGTADLIGKVEARAFGGRVRLLGFATENDLDAAEATEFDPDSTTRRNEFEWDSHSLGIEWRGTFSIATVRILGWGAGSLAGSAWAAESMRVELTSERRDHGLLASAEWTWDGGRATLGARLEGIDTFYRVKPDTASTLSYELGAWTPIGTAFVRYVRRLGSRLDLDLGASVARARGDLWTTPRIRARWLLSERASVMGGVARTHQFAQSLRNPESVVGNLFPADLFLGTEEGGLPVARSDQAVLGAEVRPSAGARIEIHGYLRESEGLMLPAPRTGEPFATDGFANGTRESRGISAEAAFQGARYGIVASYGLEEVTIVARPLRYAPGHSATHRLEGGVTFHPMATASVRFGVVAALGRRTTTSSNDYEWEACNLLDQGCEFMGSPHYQGETLGGTELPDYCRVDLGVRKHWHLGVGGRDVTWAVFGTATNVLGRSNVMSYARDLSGTPYEITMRPRAPLVLGMDWTF